MNRSGFSLGGALKWVAGTALKVGTVMLLAPKGVSPLLAGGAWLLGEVAHALKLPTPS